MQPVRSAMSPAADQEQEWLAVADRPFSAPAPRRILHRTRAESVHRLGRIGEQAAAVPIASRRCRDGRGNLARIQIETAMAVNVIAHVRERFARAKSSALVILSRALASAHDSHRKSVPLAQRRVVGRRAAVDGAPRCA